MARPKKENAERFPSGRIKPPEKQPGTPPALMRRAFELGLRKAADPILGTVLGWHKMAGVLTDLHVCAGKKYAETQGRYDAVMGLPRRSAASPAYGSGFSSGSGRQPEDRLIEDAKKRYAKMREAVQGCGPKTIAIMDRTCVEDQHPTAWELTDLISGLNACVKHFRITA